MRLIDKLAAIAASITLAITFFATGLGVCALPDAPARMLAGSFSGTTNPETPFTNEELVDMAIATKHYSFDTHDESELYSTMWFINQQAILEGRLDPTASGAPSLNDAPANDAPAADGSIQTPNIAAMAAALASADERYVFTPEAISHLDDVYHVVEAVRIPLAIIGLFAIAAAAHVGVRAGRKPLGGVLVAAGSGLFAALAVVGAWALIDFNGFFSVFHSLFFAADSWTFSWDSLLITALPLPFWMGMAGLWLGVAALLSVASILTGMKLRRR